MLREVVVRGLFRGRAVVQACGLGFASSGFLMAGGLAGRGRSCHPGSPPVGPRKQRNESMCSRWQAHSWHAHLLPPVVLASGLGLGAGRRCWQGRERKQMAGILSLPFLCSSLEGMCPCLFLFAPKFGVGVGRAEISNAATGPHSILVSQGTTEPKTKGGAPGSGDGGSAWPCCRLLFLV